MANPVRKKLKQIQNSEFCILYSPNGPCPLADAVAWCSDLINYVEKDAQHPGPVRPVRIC
jgi:hypothetical protein